MAKDAFYFSHDSNAHKDPKILKLRAKHGWEGYGIYWAIIETLREQNDYKWKASDKHLLSFCFANGDELINQVIDSCLEIGLLKVDDDGFIHSESLTNRMKFKDEIKEKRREAGKKGGSRKKKPTPDTDNKQISSKSLANDEANPSNKRKEKESKVNISNNNKLNEHPYDFLTEDDERFTRIHDLYIKNIYLQMPLAVEQDIKKWLYGNFFDEPEEIIGMAINIMAIKNKDDWSYAAKILNNWKDEDFKTVADIEKNQADYEAKKKRREFKAVPKIPNVSSDEEADKRRKEFEEANKPVLSDDEVKELQRQTREMLYGRSSIGSA